MTTLAQIYAKVPGIACKRLCQEACGPIGMSRHEQLAIISAASQIPEPTGAACPLLKDGSCSVYEVRPLICRLWGVTEGMPCPWGCEPERVLSDDEAGDLLAAAVRLSHGDYRYTHSAAVIRACREVGTLRGRT